MTKCQESDTLSDYESNWPIILAQRSFNHLELQVIISMCCFGIIPATHLYRAKSQLSENYQAISKNPGNDFEPLYEAVNMADKEKTKGQLINELVDLLRQGIL